MDGNSAKQSLTEQELAQLNFDSGSQQISGKQDIEEGLSLNKDDVSPLIKDLKDYIIPNMHQSNPQKEDTMSNQKYYGNLDEAKNKDIAQSDQDAKDQDVKEDKVDEEVDAGSNQHLKEMQQRIQAKSQYRKMKTKEKEKMFDFKLRKIIKKAKKKENDILIKRKLFRILLLLAIEAVVIALVISFFNSLGYNRGSVEINASNTVNIQVNKCVIKIVDYTNPDSLDLNYLSNTVIPSSISSDILMTYSFPDITRDSHVSSLTFLTFQGNFEASNFHFTTSASIETSEGDISIQSLYSVSANVKLTNKYYCVTTYSSTSITDAVTYNAGSCTLVFGYGVTDFDPKNQVASRCYSGTITIPSDLGGTQNLSIKNTFGNVFINVLQQIGDAADQTPKYSAVFDSSIYGTFGDAIKFSSNSQTQLSSSLKSAVSPNVYDPIFILKFGTSQVASNTYSQWQLTFNPAYSYFKPWWLGTLTLGLMNSNRYENQYVLAPGFCPYVNSLSEKRMNSLYQLIESSFSGQQNSNSFVLSMAWQHSIALPPYAFLPSSSFKGVRQTSRSENYEDDWLKIIKNTDGTISVLSLTLSEIGVLQAAVIVSIILAFVVGLVLIVGVVYVVNVNYIYLLQHISNTDMYAQIQQSNANQSVRSVVVEEEQENDESSPQDQQQDSIDEKQKEVVQIQYSVKGLIKLFYNLIDLSPPLSAYIDQVVLLFQKARSNSVREFYKVLFKEVQINEKASDDIIHNLEKDSISGSEMKGLYEQYCYLNKLLERKLDEDDGILYLQKRGFKIVNKYDALIQSYSYVKFNGKIVSVSDTQNKGSLEIFISACCTLTKFENDFIDSITFEQYYDDFCSMNHIPKQPMSEGQLQRDFGIETKYNPSQVIERDPSYDLKSNKKMFIVDKVRAQNTFKLLLTKNIESKEFKTEQMEEVKQEIFAPNFWWFYDAMVVVAHIGSVMLLGCPVLILIIFVRVQQSNYSSVPIQRQLYIYDILEQPSSIPYKLMSDNSGIQAITIISAVFFVLSTWDLIYYYFSMSFPQERYFQAYQKSGFARKLTSKVMWVIVLIVLYGMTIYLSLVGTWLILSAIINPEAFLPYATSAATFITLVTKKYQQFKNLSENGIKMLTDYLKGLAEKQFKDILKKMDLGGKIESIIPTDSIKSLCSEAASLGLIDPKLADSIQDNVEIMIRDPDAVAHLGKDILQIAQDPRQYAIGIMGQLEDKAKQQLEQQLKQYLPLMSKNLTQLTFSILTDQKSRLKTELGTVLSDLCLEIQSKNAGKVDPVLMKQLEILSGPILRLIFECQSNDSISRKEQIDNIVQQFSGLISSFVLAKFPFKEEDYNKAKNALNNLASNANSANAPVKQGEKYDLKALLNDSLSKLVKSDQQITEKAVERSVRNIFNGIYNIYSEFEKKNPEQLMKEFSKLLQEFQSVPIYQNVQELSKFTELINLIIDVSMNLKSLSQSTIMEMLSKFIQESDLQSKLPISSFNVIEFIDFLLIIIGAFNQQQKTPDVSQIKEKFMAIFKESPETSQSDIKTLSSLAAFLILQLRSNTQNIPTDVLKDLFTFINQKFSAEDQGKRIFEFFQLILANQGGGSKGNSVQSKLLIMQQTYCLLEKIYNNTIGQIENLEMNSSLIYGVPKDFQLFFLNMLKCRNTNIMTETDWSDLTSSKYFNVVANKMKMSVEDLQGLINFILNKMGEPTCQQFIRMIFNQYKVTNIFYFFKKLTKLEKT